MSYPHIHLLLNHAPSFGMLFGIAILLIGLYWRKSQEVVSVALMLFVLSALVAVPVYLTGDGAASDIRQMPSFSKAFQEDHETSAVVSFSMIGLVGLLLLWGLFTFYKTSEFPKRLITIMLVLSMLTALSFIITGRYGGQINHPELRTGFTPAPPAPDDD